MLNTRLWIYIVNSISYLSIIEEKWPKIWHSNKHPNPSLGPCEENRRTFVDELVMFTRKRAPLIGVRRWKDEKENVKTSIAHAVMVCKWHMHIYSFISCIYSGRHFISYLQKVALKISIFFRTVLLGYRRHWWNEAKDLEDCTTTLQRMASHF